MAERFTRRTLFYQAGRLTAFGAVAGLLQACGGSATTPTVAQPTVASTPLVFPTPVPQQPARPAGTAPAAASVIPQTGAAATPQSTRAAASVTPVVGGTVKDVTVTVVDGSEANSLDPPIGTGPFQSVMNGIFEGLVVWNERMELDPVLATSWEPSADGKQWIFKLREGVKFHDGTPFTSEAVKVSIEHLLDPATASTRRASYTLIKTIATPDPLTVVFTTDLPNPDIPYLLADGSARIISPAALQKFGKDFGRNPVGTGPFRFEEWVANDHISAVINPEYWGNKPQVRRLSYKPVPESATRVVVLRTGEADVVMNLPPADQAALSQNQDLIINKTPSLTTVMIELRVTKPPFNDRKVRYALNQAIDKNAIIDKVMRGQALPLKTPGIGGLFGTAEFEPLAYDPAKAKQLLAEAGFANGFDMTLSYVSGRWPGDDQVVEAVQGYLTQIGVRVAIKKVDNAGLVTDLALDPDQNPGLAIMPVRSSFYLDYHLYRMYHSAATKANAAQRSGYSNPEVDKLIEQEQAIFDPAKRLPVFEQAQRAIWEDMPFIFLFQQTSLWGQRKNVSGFGVPPTGSFLPRQLRKD